ncbi:DNA polymerase III subunit delta [Patescibacteria group bacterium]
MLILLYGEDDFRLGRKLNEIVKEYKVKHSSGLDLAIFDNDLDFEKVREKIESISMFNEKKLIVLKNIFGNLDFEEVFFGYSKKRKLKNNQDVIVVLYHSGKLAVSGLKRKVSMSEEFKPLKGMELSNWIKKEIGNNNGIISNAGAQKLASFVGNDLWRANNEINKLLSYKINQEITLEDIDLLVGAKIDNNIFNTLDALANQDKKNAFKLLHKHLSQGENEIYLLTMFIYQIRNLLKLKDLIESGTPFYSLANKSGLHPFVVKKSSYVLRNFSLDQLKRIYHLLLEFELKLKSGRIDGLTALDLLAMEI